MDRSADRTHSNWHYHLSVAALAHSNISTMERCYIGNANTVEQEWQTGGYRSFPAGDAEANMPAGQCSASQRKEEEDEGLQEGRGARVHRGTAARRLRGAGKMDACTVMIMMLAATVDRD